VYFDGHGSCFRRADVRVPVWHKEPFGARMICYCFAESEASIRTEIDAHRLSSVVERVRARISTPIDARATYGILAAPVVSAI
jgi:hypothetical protein